MLDGLITKQFNNGLAFNFQVEQFIQEELIFDPGYHYLMYSLSFSAAPQKIAGEMLLFCVQLISMIQAKKPPAEIAAKALELRYLQPFSVSNDTVSAILVNVILMHHGIPPIIIDQDKSLKAYEQGKLTDYVTSVINTPRAFNINDEGVVLNQQNNRVLRLTHGNYIVRTPNVIYLLKLGSDYPDRDPREMTEFLSPTPEQIEALKKENKIEIMNSEACSELGHAIVDTSDNPTEQDISDITNKQYDRFLVAGFCFLMAAKFSIPGSAEQADAYYRAAFCYSRTTWLQSAYHYADLANKIADGSSDIKLKSTEMIAKLNFVKDDIEKSKEQSKQYKNRVADLLKRYSTPEQIMNLNRMLRTSAVNNCHQDIQLILELGAFINTQSETDQQTALHWATNRNHKETFESLLKFNAHWNIKNKDGKTVVDILINSDHEALKVQLETKMCEKYKTGNDKSFALRRAAALGFLDDVKFLMHRGADVMSQSSNGNTALDWAKEKGHTSIISFLEGPSLKPTQPKTPQVSMT